MKRYKPSATQQADLLTEWGNRCVYCRLPFGLLIWKSGIGSMIGSGMNTLRYYRSNHAAIVLHVEWDHFTPFTYSDSSADDQFLPACQVCNQLKGDKLFRSIEGAREYLEPRWLRRYEMAQGPPQSWEAAAASEAADYAF